MQYMKTLAKFQGPNFHKLRTCNICIVIYHCLLNNNITDIMFYNVIYTICINYWLNIYLETLCLMNATRGFINFSNLLMNHFKSSNKEFINKCLTNHIMPKH